MENILYQQQEAPGPERYWRGLGGWNYYFLLKLGLLWYGFLNFHAFANLVFLAFLVFPVPPLKLHHLRNWIAIPIGLGLFYHDTWLPDIYTLQSQGSNLFAFSPAYLWELLNRFINWNMAGMAMVLLVAYLFISQWIRVSTLTIVAISWLNIIAIQGPAISLMPTTNNTVAKNADKTPQFENNLPPTNANLNAWLTGFYKQQKLLRTGFPNTLPKDAQPFDVLILQLCSISWSDIDAVNLQNHPIWNKFDILFKDFNSAASYSGPAAIRLLRASCGQTTHDKLYSPVAPECYLMDNLAKLGFPTLLTMDHQGTFGNFLQEIQEYGGLKQIPLMSQAGLSPEMTAFNGQAIYNDTQVLNRWIEQRNKSGNSRSATFSNFITLHDGNRSITDDKPVPWKNRANTLFDKFDNFFNALEKSGRKVVVIMIGEHGANLIGDKLQMPGLRNIPSPSITHIPVGIKFIGIKAPHQNNPLQINVPSSYLALSELLSRLVDGKLFNQAALDLSALTQNLPQTASVSVNEGVTVIKYQGKPWILLRGENNWVPYT